MNVTRPRLEFRVVDEAHDDVELRTRLKAAQELLRVVHQQG